VLEKPSRTILTVKGTILDAATAPGELDWEYWPFACETESRIRRQNTSEWIFAILIGF
jgi:hypothetical protein